MAGVWSSVSQLILNRKVLSVPQTKTKTRFWFLLNTVLAWKKELIPTCISEIGLDTISSRKPPLITKDQVRSLLSVPTAPSHETEHPVARLPGYVCGPPDCALLAHHSILSLVQIRHLIKMHWINESLCQTLHYQRTKFLPRPSRNTSHSPDFKATSAPKFKFLLKYF